MKLNIRQQKYKKNRLLGMNKYNAARAAGYTDATARSHTSELDERVKIADVLERQGLTDEILTKKLSELLDASKDIYAFSGLDTQEKGVSVKLGSPEWSARAKGLELALKLKDHLKERVEHSGEIKGTAVQIIQFNDTRKTDSPGPEARISKFDTSVATGDTPRV